MSASGVKVVIRTRPSEHFDSETLAIGQDNQTVKVHLNRRRAQTYVNHQREDWNFRVNKVLHNSTQQQTYIECAKDAVNHALEGFNATVIAHGQNGSGKTYTILGADESYEHRGIVPRSISQVFDELEQRASAQLEAFQVHVSVLEFYKDSIRDLLSSEDERCDLQLKDDESGVSVKGVNRVLVETEAEAFQLLFRGQAERMTQVTSHLSSKSHLIFTLHITSVPMNQEAAGTCAKIHFVDLAGPEPLTPGTNRAKAETMESKYINKSHTFLEQVVVAVGGRKREGGFIPYRQSKLTHFLKDSIGGNCFCTLIGNIHADPKHIDASITTLRFAARMTHVVNRPHINMLESDTATIKRLESEITLLRQELAVEDSLHQREVRQHRPFTHLEQLEIERLSSKFIQGDIDVNAIPITSVRQVQEVFRQLRKLRVTPPTTTPNSTEAEPTSLNHSKSGTHDDEGVGKLSGSGFHIGLTTPNKQQKRRDKVRSSTKPKANLSDTGPIVADETMYAEALAALRNVAVDGHAKPTAFPIKVAEVKIKAEDLVVIAKDSLKDVAKMLLDLAASLTVGGESEGTTLGELIHKLPDPIDFLAMTKEEAYDHFKTHRGQEPSSHLDTNNDLLHQKRSRSKTISLNLNSITDEVDALTTKMQSMQSYFATQEMSTTNGHGNQQQEQQQQHHHQQQQHHHQQQQQQKHQQLSKTLPVMDEPVFDVYKRINALKQTYKGKHTELTQLTTEISNLETQNRGLRKALLGDFHTWYAAVTGVDVDHDSSSLASVHAMGARLDVAHAHDGGRVLTGTESSYNVTRNAVLRRMHRNPEKARRLSSIGGKFYLPHITAPL